MKYKTRDFTEAEKETKTLKVIDATRREGKMKLLAAPIRVVDSDTVVVVLLLGTKLRTSRGLKGN
ncbi:hypothetical protein J6590_080611 [Homalodisca vitripennis]|nr:hypothetical protein J6590_080611 [Homalodisca vitripennis]